MESSTKNRQSREQLEQMVEKGFPGVGVRDIQELTEGYFNVAYLMTLGDGREVILKVAPLPDALIMSYEKNIMYSEVMAMRLVQEHTSVPVAEVLYYDPSRTLCPSEYFFMSKLSGRSLFAMKEDGVEVDESAIQYRVGQLNREINTIVGQQFGYCGQPDLQSRSWYEAFRWMLETAVADARAKDIDMTIDPDEMLRLLERDRDILGEVTQPTFVHWDLWDGNIFVENGQVVGLIDLERCIWADPLLEVGFRSNNQHPDFLRGYGKTTFTPSEQRRILWYDAYGFSVGCLEYEYRQYDSTFFYDLSTEGLRKAMDSLRAL